MKPSFSTIRNCLPVIFLLIVWMTATASSPADSRKANEAYREGNYELAAELYQQAISDDPENAQLYFNLGNTLAELGRTEEANQAFERYKNLVEAANDQSLADYNIGKLYADQNELEKAVEQFREALKKNPLDADAKHNYELAKKKLQQQQEQQQNQDQQNQDQNQDEQNQQQNQNQDQQQDEQQNRQNSDENQPQDQQSSSQNNQQSQMNMEEAERILEALDQRERDLLRNQQKDTQNATPNSRNW